MVFNGSIVWIFVLIVLGWLAGLTYLLIKTLANYNRLTEGITDKTLSEILNNFLEQDKLTRAEMSKIHHLLDTITHDSRHFIQKVGLVRFNPFSDTGGDQSFSLALLDGEESGFIITSLYARTGVRWYVKTIREGKGIEHDLSNEEKEVLKKAKKAN